MKNLFIRPPGIAGVFACAALALLTGFSTPAAIAASALSATAEAKIIDTGTGWASAFGAPDERIPVIVEFALPALPEADGVDAEKAEAAQVAAVAAEQTRILSKVFGGTAGISAAQAATTEIGLKLMSYSPQFALAATAEELEMFAADPSVTKIYEDALAAPLLTQSVPLVGMPNAYAQGGTGNGATVAVLDTGGRRTHEFLSSRIVEAACYNSNTGGAASLCPGGVTSSTDIDSANDCDASGPISGCGHGTHVAGTAAGFNTNRQAGEPEHGVARDGRIFSINVFSQFTGSSNCGSLPAGKTSCVLSNSSDQILALERVNARRTALNIASVNMSLGGGNFTTACDASDPRTTIVNTLRANNVAVVISAGNSSENNRVGAPGCISAAITVASSTKSDAVSSFSNWGDLVDVVAPGSSIYAPYTTAANGYSSLNGTSMAAPHVAGAWAAIRSRLPGATVTQIENALESTGVPLIRTNSPISKPRIRVDGALSVLLGGSPPGPANDNFANRTLISANNSIVGRALGTNAFASKEGGEPNHAGVASATSSAWWGYTPLATGTMVITTVGSNFNTVLAVYTGNAVNALTPVASNNDSGGTNLSQVQFTAVAGTQYKIAVAGVGGAGGDVVLNVTPGAPPANDNFVNRVPIPVPAAAGTSTIVGNNLNATKEAGEPDHTSYNLYDRTVWWRYTPTATGPVIIDTAGSDFDTQMAVYTGSAVGALTKIASNDTGSGISPASRVQITATAGVQYQIAITGWSGTSGNVRVNVTNGTTPPPNPPPFVPANNNFAGRIAIAPPAVGGTQTVYGRNVNANKETGEPAHAGINHATTSVWWRYTPSSSGQVTIDTVGSNFNTVLAVYTGASVTGLTQVAANDDASGISQRSRVQFAGVAGTQYQIAVAGYGGQSSNIAVNVTGGGGTPPPGPASIVSAVTPVARAAAVGTTVTAFATVLNASTTNVATSCTIAAPSGLPLVFSYRTFNTTTGAIGGVQNPSVNIAANGRADFLLSFRSTAAMSSNMAMVFDCSNTNPAASVSGLNTFLMTGTAGAVADVISTAVTATNDGIANIPLGGTGFAALAAVNIGAGSNLQARLQTNAIGAANNPLPLTLTMCQTNPSTGACISAQGATVNFTAGANQTVTFSAFATSNGTPIAFDPAGKRMFVHFFQSNTPVGSASVAVRTTASDASLASVEMD